jgi:hypothetical protein
MMQPLCFCCIEQNRGLFAKSTWNPCYPDAPSYVAVSAAWAGGHIHGIVLIVSLITFSKLA